MLPEGPAPMTTTSYFLLFNREGSHGAESDADGAIGAFVLEDLQVEAEHVQGEVGAGAHASGAGNAFVPVHKQGLIRALARRFGQSNGHFLPGFSSFQRSTSCWKRKTAKATTAVYLP